MKNECLSSLICPSVKKLTKIYLTMPQSPSVERNNACEPRSFKITVVGDGNVGKTCLLISYTKNKFPTDYVPTVFDNHRTNVNVDGVEYPITCWDTAGQEAYDRLRILTYPKTDCFIICYALDKQSSFDNVSEKWYPELRRHCPNAVVILVGTKSDLRDSNGVRITEKQCRKMKSRIGAYKHVQCSARTRENLEQVFIEAVRAMKKSREKKDACTVI